MNIVLTGFRGTGKTTVGGELALILKYGFIDCDETVEKKTGKTIMEIFQEQGEKTFRSIEAEVIESLSGSVNKVIATGGGAILSEENRRNLKELGMVVWLKAETGAIRDRIRNSMRPSLTGDRIENEIEKLLKVRENYYSEIADYTIDTTGLSVMEVVNAVQHFWRIFQNNNIR
jgi:shikimate kinase